MRAGANGLPNPNDIVTLVAPGAGPVHLEIGPGGDLFYSGYDDGTIRRIRYFAANQPPIAVAQAAPTNGIAPLVVSFDGRASSDPEGGALAYAWDLDADGQYDDSTSATPSRTYTQNGQVTVRLRVTDPSGATDIASIVITVGNSAPVATISVPTAATTWAVGESIPFSGTGVDAQSGTLPASAFLWELVLHHCPSTCHEHELQSFPGVWSGAFDGPNHDYPAHLELRLTVTDSGGLKDTKSVLLQPKTVQTTFATSIPGLQLTVDDDTAAAPFTRTTIVGSTHTVSAPATQTLYGVEFTFQSWSDGGARVHQLTTTSAATITAQYSGGTPAACFYNPATKSVAASIAPASQATLKIAASGQLLFGLVPMPCSGATATNTDTVVVTGTAGTAERLTIDQSEAFFGPGAEVESNIPEIEVVANLGDTSDRLVVVGTAGDDKLSAGLNGVGIDADNDVDVTFAPSPAPAIVELAGGGGKNTLTARGGTGTGSPFAGGVVLRAGDLGDTLSGSNLADLLVGGAGNDDVNGYAGDDTIDGGAGDDKLNGADGRDDTLGGLGADSISSGAGDDTIRAADGLVDPVLNGGAGIDTAYYDLIDPVPSGREQDHRLGAPSASSTARHDAARDGDHLGAGLADLRDERDLRPRLERDGLDLRVRPRPRRVPPLRLAGHLQRTGRQRPPAARPRRGSRGQRRPDAGCLRWTIETAPPPPPPPPPGQGTCAYSATQKSVTATIPAGAAATLSVVGSEIRFAGVACGAATTTNTDAITVVGVMGSVERLVVDQSAGALAPGATAETVGTASEIELAVSLGDVADEFVLRGTPAADLLSVGSKGVSFTSDTDLDITFSQLLSSVELIGGGGNDTLTAGGGYGTSQAFLGRVTLRGEDGDDVLSGSILDDLILGGPGSDTIEGGSGSAALLGEGGADALTGRDGNDRLVGGPGSDSLSGGNGDDTLEAADGEADALIHGQVGVDTPYYDLGLDPAPVSAENAIPGPPPPTGLAR